MSSDKGSVPDPKVRLTLPHRLSPPIPNRPLPTRQFLIYNKKRHHSKNKAIVDSRLRPQWCFHLANVTEMEEMLDCKPDALIRSFAWEKKRFSCQHKVPVSRDLLPWPWPWTHTGCMVTWSPSCASLVAIRPFACENWWWVQIHTNSLHCVHCGQTDCNTSRRRYRGRAK